MSDFKEILYTSPNYPFIKCNISDNEVFEFNKGSWIARSQEAYDKMEAFLNSNPQNRAMIQMVDMNRAEEIAKNYMKNAQVNSIGKGPLTAGMMAEARVGVSEVRTAAEAEHSGVKLTTPPVFDLLKKPEPAEPVGSA